MAGRGGNFSDRAWNLFTSPKDASGSGCSNGEKFNGHFRILKWRYLPYIRPIFEAYVREYPQKIWPEKWY